MVLRRTTTLHRTGNGSQAYFPVDVTQDSQMPLQPGGEVTVQIVPGRAVVILPATIKLPDAYPIEIELTEPDPGRTAGGGGL